MPVHNLDKYQLAPNVSRAILDAVRVLEHRQASLLISTLPFVIEKALECVAENAIRVGNDVGWDHYLGNQRIGIVGTSLGVLALSQSPSERYRDLLHSATNTLIRTQHAVGGWTTRSLGVDKGHPVTVSTGYAMLALTSCGQETTHQDVIAKAADWLVKTQRPDGGWAAWFSGEHSQVTSTTLALTALAKAGLHPTVQRRAMEWILLLNSRMEGGGSHRLNAIHPFRLHLHILAEQYMHLWKRVSHLSLRQLRTVLTGYSVVVHRATLGRMQAKWLW